MTFMKLKIIKTGINGEGIAYDHKIPVFIDGVLPGEIAEVKITSEQNRYKKGQLVRLIHTSSARRTPPCKNTRVCDGCPYMIMRYEEQLKQKQAMLTESLYKYGNVKAHFVRQIRASQAQLGYRCACKLPVRESNGKLTTGMYGKGSNRFQPITSCIVHDPQLEDIKKQILRILNQHHFNAYQTKKKTGIRSLFVRVLEGNAQVTLVTGRNTELSQDVLQEMMAIPGVISLSQSINTETKGNAFFGSAAKILAGRDTLPVTMNGIHFQLSPESFFQLNAKQAEKMYAYAIAKTDPCDLLVEAYCGIGAISMLACKKAKKVIGIESSEKAVENAKQTAENNAIQNCDFIVSDAAPGIYKIARTERIDILIADPPRSGMDERMLQAILDTTPEKIIYISCNPGTLAKNLKVLKQKYHVVTITPFDLFPETPLCESVTVLERG